MNRKDFFRSCGGLCLGVSAVLPFLAGCGAIHYANATFDKDRLVVSRSEFLKEKNGAKTERSFVVIRMEKLPFPICIFRHHEQGFISLYMECTHSSCELTPHGDYLICPCHGSEFNIHGEVQNPPAEQNLRTFKTTFDDNSIFISLI